jgi:hypothetical protein
VARVAVEGLQQDNYEVVFPTPFSKVQSLRYVCVEPRYTGPIRYTTQLLDSCLRRLRWLLILLV